MTPTIIGLLFGGNALAVILSVLNLLWTNRTKVATAAKEVGDVVRVATDGKRDFTTFLKELNEAVDAVGPLREILVKLTGLTANQAATAPFASVEALSSRLMPAPARYTTAQAVDVQALAAELLGHLDARGVTLTK